MSHPKHADASGTAKPDSPVAPEMNPATTPPDPARVNPGTEPGESFGERWTNKVYSTPDPQADRAADLTDAGKHHEPTPFLRG